MHALDRRWPLMKHYMLGGNPEHAMMEKLCYEPIFWYTEEVGISRDAETPVPDKTFAALALDFKESLFDYYAWGDVDSDRYVEIDFTEDSVYTKNYDTDQEEFHVYAPL